MTTSRSRAVTSNGFTLVELLTVIGIIAVLIGMLLPTLGRAREQARLILCQSNIRSLQTAYLMYTSDNRGYVPGASTYSWPDWVTVGFLSYNPLVDKPQSGTIGKYLPGPNVYFCPSEYRPGTPFSYAMFSTAGFPTGGLRKNWLKITRLRPADRQAVFIEDSDDRGAPYGQFDLNRNNPNVKAFTDVPGELHKIGPNRGANVSFVDGHVEYRRWQDPRTIRVFFRQRANVNLASPGNKDLDWLYSVADAYLSKK